MWALLDTQRYAPVVRHNGRQEHSGKQENEKENV